MRAEAAYLCMQVALLCCAVCFRMHRLYYDAMWTLVLRRELKLSDAPLTLNLVDGTDGHHGGEEVLYHLLVACSRT